MRRVWICALTLTAVAIAGCGGGTASKTAPSVTGNSWNQHVVSIAESDLASCELPPSPSANALGSGVDRNGRKLSKLDHSRVVSVAMGAAESVAALGFTASLVGRDLASGGAALTQVPVVTDVHSINAEKVLAQRPSFVLIDDQSTPKTALEQIAAAGITLVKIPTAWKVEDVAPRLTAIAAAFGDPGRASSLLQQCRHDVPAGSRPVRVAFLYLRGTAAVYLLGGRGSGADSLIQSAGDIDVGAEAGLKPFTPITPEVMATLKPDVLLVMTKGLSSVGGIQGLKQLAGVSQTPAARAGRVVEVQDALLLSFGAKTWALVDALQKAFADAAQ